MKDSNFLKENNGRYFWQPMGHPGVAQTTPPIIFNEADGVDVIDIDGHRVVDAVGGLWNVNLGYSNTVIKDAMKAQIDALPYYSAFKGTTNDKAIELSYLMQEFFAPDGLSRSFFTSGGSDSVEVALKLARQYHRIKGHGARTKFISLLKGYHGTHFGGASVNGNAKFRNSYEPLIAGCFHVPAPYTYRNPWNESDPEKLAQLAAQALDDEITFQGANTVAAFIMEPVLGAGGVIPPHPSYMGLVREICDRHGVLLIADEVITGFGRTGDPSGVRHWGVKPDLMTLAKAITSGYFPFGAVMISDAVAEVFESADASGSVDTGYTYSGHPIGAATAVATLNETNRIAPWTNAAPRGAELKAGLQELQLEHDVIGDVRGEGLMCGMELVSDRDAKTPLDPNEAMRFQKAAYEAGAMIRVSGHNVLFSPPLIVSSNDIDRILTAVKAGLGIL
ncbi:MAG: aminotransferase class III-fold pyridoxal phosphate-dependent enzyme [Pseudomonadota bacterium]